MILRNVEGQNAKTLRPFWREGFRDAELLVALSRSRLQKKAPKKEGQRAERHEEASIRHQEEVRKGNRSRNGACRFVETNSKRHGHRVALERIEKSTSSAWGGAALPYVARMSHTDTYDIDVTRAPA
jgi:hypothetical protein